jgi:hypothetical protein
VVFTNLRLVEVRWLTYPFEMKKHNGLGLAGLALSVCLGLLPAAQAVDTRAAWDFNKLEKIDAANQVRAVFGYNTFSSLNDDYSFYVDGEDAFSNVLLAPCLMSELFDSKYWPFNACIEGIDSRKVGTSQWVPGALSSTQLGKPTTSILKKGIDTHVGEMRAYDPNFFRPAGYKSTLWELNSPHSNGNKYLVRAAIYGWDINKDISTYDGGLQKYFRLEVLPVEVPGNKVITQDQIVIQEFPQNYEYRVRLRLAVFVKSISGWFFSRLSDPKFVREFATPDGRLEISGKPALVPVGITNVLPKSATPTDFCADFTNFCETNQVLFDRAITFSDLESWDPKVLGQWERVPGGVKTAATLSIWRVDTSRLADAFRDESAESQKCIADLYGKGARVFLGAVMSNASLYQSTPPSWDDVNKSFVFKVGSPHLDEHGQPNKGNYTLYIPIEMAKCRWGEASSTGKAEIQVVNADGTSSITTVAATTENGNLRFNIAGFGYSSPTVKIRMGSNIGKISSPISPTPNAVVQTALKCVKGKTVKKVVGAKPVCPSGYKKVPA